jgi:hypothetical protein
MIGFLHLDLFNIGWGMFCGSVGCLIGAMVASGTAYERGQRDQYRAMLSRLKAQQRERNGLR